MTYATFVRNRNKKTEQAFQAIDDAKRILADLERFAVQAAEGTLPDIGETADKAHALRNATDRTLMSLVEACLVPEGAPCKSTDSDWRR